MTTTRLLNVGLPRTGSLALHRFFQCLGICSHHYCCGAETEQEEEGTQFPCPNNQQTCGECLHANLLEQQQEPFRFCGRPCQAAKENNNNIVAFMQFDVESSQPSFSWFLPQHFALPLLVPRNNDNTVNIWILPKRQNATVWAQSVLHWHSVTRRLLQAFDVPYFLPDNDDNNNKNVTVGLSHTHRQSELFAELQRGIERSQNQTQHSYRREALEQIYTQHLHKVQSFVEQHNNAKHKIHLVPLVVDDPQAGAHLLEQLEPLVVAPDPTTNTHSCWRFDAKELDEDWKNLSLPF